MKIKLTLSLSLLEALSFYAKPFRAFPHLSPLFPALTLKKDKVTSYAEKKGCWPLNVLARTGFLRGKSVQNGPRPALALSLLVSYAARVRETAPAFAQK